MRNSLLVFLLLAQYVLGQDHVKSVVDLGALFDASAVAMATPTQSFGLPIKVQAVVPTAAGEIGVNPVDLMTAHPDYYLVVEGATKWKGPYDHIVQTTTQNSNGVETVATQSVQMAVHTATVASEGVAVGDVNLVLSPAAVAALDKIFKAAETACMAIGVRRRQVASGGVCVIDHIRSSLTPELTAGIDGSAVFSDSFAVGVEAYAASLEGLAARVLAGLILLSKEKTLPWLLGAMGLIFATWSSARIMSYGITIPSLFIEPHPNSPNPTTASSKSRSTSYQQVSPMTDYYQPIPTPLDHFLADAVANALALRFAPMEAAAPQAPSPANCIKRVVKDCVFVLDLGEDEDEKSLGLKLCPEIPRLPDHCPPGKEGKGNTPYNPGPVQTQELLVFWVTPKRNHIENVNYKFFIKPLNYTHLYTPCGILMAGEVPTARLDDPTLVDDSLRYDRTKPPTLRLPPGVLKLGDVAGKKNCQFNETHTVSSYPPLFTCDDGFSADCYPPPASTVTKLFSNDFCGEPTMRDWVNLTLTCPY